MDIKSILGEEYLDKFRVFGERTLFEPSWEALLEDRCPFCFNRLRKSWKLPIVLCPGKKHALFFISASKLEEIKSRH